MSDATFSENGEALFELLERFLAGELKEAEADDLLCLIDRHPTLPALIRRQIELDSLLRNQVVFPEFYRYTSTKSPEEPEVSDLDDLVSRAAREAGAFPKVARSETDTERTGSVDWLRRAKSFFPKSLETLIRRSLIFFLGFLCCGIMIEVLEIIRTQSVSGNVVAHLIDSRKAVWENPATAPETGGPIHEGILRLLDGVAVIKMLNGAEIVLEGPGELNFESLSRLLLSRGRISADVPPQQQKLVVATPQMEIKVLGTAFWVDVDADKTDVHLVRGRLELNSPALGPFQIGENEAFSLSGIGASKRFAAALDFFVPSTKIDRRSEEIGRQRQDDWLKASESLNARKDILLRFDFEHSDGDRLVNLAEAGKERLEGARTIDCRTDEGRWNGKKALAFDGRNSRIAFELPGNFQGLTLFASIRVDSLENAYNGILMSEFSNIVDGRGRLHWQIMNDGSIRVGLSPQGSAVMSSDSTYPVVKSHELGSWIKLALVLDATSGRITQYVNGRRVSEGKMPNGLLPEIGSANLGFWRPETGKEATRCFRGAMDELMIFDRALRPDEVRDL